MKEITEQEIQNFLMTGTLTGKVASSRKDGLAHVVPVCLFLITMQISSLPLASNQQKENT